MMMTCLIGWWWRWRYVNDDKLNVNDDNGDDNNDDGVDDDVSMMTEQVKVSRLWIHLPPSTLHDDDDGDDDGDGDGDDHHDDGDDDDVGDDDHGVDYHLHCQYPHQW